MPNATLLSVEWSEDGTTKYLPWTDGEAVGFACLVDGKTVGYVYLNPAGDSGNGPEVAVYVAADPQDHDREPVMVLEATPWAEDE